MNSTKYTTQAMLMRLSRSYWQAVVTDQTVSARVATLYNNDQDSGRWHKYLFKKGTVPLYAKLLSAFSYAESLHKLETLKFLPAVGILPVRNYNHYLEVMRNAAMRIEIAKHEFAPVYPRYVEEQKQYLNGTWDASDYPDPGEILKKFSMSTHVMPLPDGMHFDVEGITNADEIRAEITAEMATALEGTVMQLYLRLNDTLRDLGGKLSGDKNIRKQSLSRAKEDVARLDILNLTGNGTLQALSKQAYAMIDSFDLEAINTRPIARATSLAAVEALKKQMTFV